MGAAHAPAAGARHGPPGGRGQHHSRNVAVPICHNTAKHARRRAQAPGGCQRPRHLCAAHHDEPAGHSGVDDVCHPRAVWHLPQHHCRDHRRDAYADVHRALVAQAHTAHARHGAPFHKQCQRAREPPHWPRQQPGERYAPGIYARGLRMPVCGRDTEERRPAPTLWRERGEHPAQFGALPRAYGRHSCVSRRCDWRDRHRRADSVPAAHC